MTFVVSYKLAEQSNHIRTIRQAHDRLSVNGFLITIIVKWVRIYSRLPR
jgi:hypothetical protein